MANELPARVAFRAEHTDAHSKDRTQRLAQQLTVAHEQVKDIVAALRNSSYVALAVDVATTAAALYTTLISTSITTVLDAGYLDINFTAATFKNTNAGASQFRLSIDGVVVTGCQCTTIANGAESAAIVHRAAVTKGPHTVLVQWATTTDSATIYAASIPNDFHAHLLVQEAP